MLESQGRDQHTLKQSNSFPVMASLILASLVKESNNI